MLTLSYLHQAVRFQSDDERLETELRAQFLAYGAVENGGTSTLGVVTTRRAFGPDQPAGGWTIRRIHGVTPSEQLRSADVLVTGNPLAVTGVLDREIHVLRCEDVAPIAHLHHMVKYPLRHWIETNGRILVHGAGVVTARNTAALFLGAHGAGKTTIFAELMSLGCLALGSDSILLEQAQGKVQARSWPHIIRIAPGTLAANRTLQAGGNLLPRQRSPRDGKLECFANVLDALYERRVFSAAAHSVSSIVLPQVVVGSKEWQVEALADEAAVTAVGLAVQDKFQSRWLPGWTWDESDAVREQFAAGLVAGTRVWRVRFGTALPGWPERLLALASE